MKAPVPNVFASMLSSPGPIVNLQDDFLLPPTHERITIASSV